MFDFIEQKDNQVICKKALTLILDQDMIEDNLAEIIDDKLSTIGFLKIAVKDKDKVKMYRLNLPITIMINATDIYKEENVYKIDFEPNDIIIDNSMYALSATISAKNANNFLNLVTTGKIAAEAPEEITSIFKKNIEMNGLKLKVQSALIEAMISEMCRYSFNETIPFRLALKSKKVSMKDFTMVNIKEISRLSSVFNAISFEDIKKSIEASVLMTRMNSEQSISPVESTLKY
jgi:hypothetical protein